MYCFEYEFGEEIMETENIISSAALKLLSGHQGFASNGECDVYPNKDKIADIIEMIKATVFPGYFNETHGCESQSIWLQYLLENLRRELTSVISVVFGKQHDSENTKLSAYKISAEFIRELAELQRILQTDAQAGYEGDPAARGLEEIILTYPGFYAVLVHRVANFLFKKAVPIIPRMMSEHAHSATGIDIHPGATIGEYFFIDHGTGVVIGETAVIGKHVKLYQGVTLGALSTKGGQKLTGIRRHPTIKDNVTIYAGATILGGDTVIAENITIGGNAFITKSLDQ